MVRKKEPSSCCFSCGQTAPNRKKNGHAGAIIGGKAVRCAAKISIMKECGINVVESPADILGTTVAGLPD